MPPKKIREDSDDVSTRPKKRVRNGKLGTYMDPQSLQKGVQVFSIRLPTTVPPPHSTNQPLLSLKGFGFKISIGRPKFPLFTSRPPRRHKFKITPKRAFALFRALMAGPIRTLDIKVEKQPPRPPNAWILYRSEKLRDPTLKSGNRIPQADISKMISAMWKTESEEVRAQYEYLANVKKNEHEAKYPGYRYQPMKRVDKERLREAKKLEKERERAEKKGKTRVPYAIPFLPGPIATPMSYAATESRYGPAGPSPPLSVAASPERLANDVSSKAPNERAVETPIASSSSRVSSATFSESAIASGSGSRTPNQQLASVAVEDGYATVADISLDTSQTPLQLPPLDQYWTLPGPSSSQGDVVNDWQSNMASQSSIEPTFNFSGQFNIDDYVQLSFDLPAGQEQNWEYDLSSFMPSSDTAQQATILGTNGPNIFQLGFDSNTLLQDPPPGEIEVSLSNAFAQYADPAYINSQPQPNHHELFSPEYLAELGLDWGNINNTGDMLTSGKIFEGNTVEFDFASLSSPEDMTSPSASSPSTSGSSTAQLLSESINQLLSIHQQAALVGAQTEAQANGLDLLSLEISASDLISPSSDNSNNNLLTSLQNDPATYLPIFSFSNTNSEDVTQLTLQQPKGSTLASKITPPRHFSATHDKTSSSPPYVPPAGAVNASRRRAAASWKTASFQVNLGNEEADEQREVSKQARTVSASAN